MRFHLTEEQQALQDSLLRALADCFPKSRLLEFVDGGSDFDSSSWNVLMELGLGGLALPEELGGSGLGLLEAGLALEVLGGAAAVGPIIGHLLTGRALAASTNDAARRAHLPGVANGTLVASIAFGGAWLPETWEINVSDGNVSGAVMHVQSAGAAQLILVGTLGGGLSLVRTGDRGVSTTPMKSTDRTRGLSTIRFDRAPAVELFAAGDPQVQRLFDEGLVLLAADALGGAQTCVDLSVAYAKQREQFGRPIGCFQALKHQLVNMAVEVEPARAMLWFAAYAQDAELPEASRVAALTKAHLCDRYVSVARAAIAAHGGIGYTWDYGLNIWFRRALFDRAYLGSPGVHRERAAEMADW
jgi:alkylation response protein AidB-like acyl-CoA dehydrogenase